MVLDSSSPIFSTSKRSLSVRPSHIAKNIARLQILLARKKNHLPIPGEFLGENGNGPLLALTGKDWQALSEESFHKLGKRIGGIIALDDDAAGFASCCGLPVAFVEDILGLKRTYELSLFAGEKCRSWFEPYKKFCECDGICWPLMDSAALLYFWQESMLGDAIAEVMHASGRELVVVERLPFVAPEYYYGEDNFGRGALAVGRDGVYGITAPGRRRLRSANKEIPSWPLQDLKNIAGKIVCVLNPNEVERSRHVLRDLEIRFPGEVCVLALGACEFTACEGVPVYKTPCTENWRDDGFFCSLMDSMKLSPRKDESGLERLFLRVLGYYCGQRWPSLRHTFLRFRDLFARYRPRCVMGTDLDDAESQLAYAAARPLGIPSLAWGHAWINVFSGWQPHTADRVMAQTNYGREIARRAAVPPHRIVTVSGLHREGLYPSVAIDWPVRRAGQLRVLVLPFARRIPGTANTLGSLRMAVKQVAQLTAIPKDLRENVLLRFKEHPWLRDRSPFLLNGLNAEEWCFDKHASLPSLLDACDACILLGESGCAMLEACSRVPTVLLTEDRLCFWVRGQGQAALEYPFQCESIAEVWEFIRNLCRNPACYDNRLERQRVWSNPCEHSPYWLDVVEETCGG